MPGLPLAGRRLAIIRWYRAGLAAAFFPCWAWGRSNRSSVVVAVSVTPQSMPMTLLVAGRGSSSRFTTKLAHHVPVVSLDTRTLEGTKGTSLDQTTVSNRV
jgi:hypothetical protein